MLDGVGKHPSGAAQLEYLPHPRFSPLLGAPPGPALGGIRLPVKQRQGLQAILIHGTFFFLFRPHCDLHQDFRKVSEEEMKAMSPNALRSPEEPQAALVCGTSELGVRDLFSEGSDSKYFHLQKS